LRRGDRLPWGAAASGVGHYAHAQPLDQLEEAHARVATGLLAAHRHGEDARARSLDGVAHDLRRGVACRSQQQPRGNLDAIKGERLGAAERAVNDIHRFRKLLPTVTRTTDCLSYRGLSPVSTHPCN